MQKSTTMAPSPSRWDEIRPFFTQLYFEHRKSLREVQTILREVHGFEATERMYKRRIGRWALSKYLAEKEVKPVVVLVARRRREGKRSIIRIRDKEVKFSAIRRYARRKKKANLEEIIAQDECDKEAIAIPKYVTCTTPESSSDTLEDAEDELWWCQNGVPLASADDATQLMVRKELEPVSSTIWPVLSPSGELLHMHHLLYSSNVFFDPSSSEIRNAYVRPDLIYSHEVQQFESCLHQAVMCADIADSKTMNDLYGQAISLVPAILRENQSLNFLICLFVILACCKTERRLALVPAILCYVTHATAYILHERHPLCQILHALHNSLPPHRISSSSSICTSSNSSSSSSSSSSHPPTPPDLHLIPYLIERCLHAALDSLQTFHARFDPRARIVAYGLFETLFAAGQYVGARALIRETWRKEEEVLGRRSTLTLWSMMAVGRCSIELREVEEGQKVLDEVSAALDGVGLSGHNDRDWVTEHVEKCALLHRRNCVHRKWVRDMFEEAAEDYCGL